MPRGKKAVEEVKDEEVVEVSETVNGVKLRATGKFEAADGVVYSPEGKAVSKKMDVVKAEDVARKFNDKMK